MIEAEVQVVSADFARALNNALAHVPSKMPHSPNTPSLTAVVVMHLNPSESTLTVLGSDTYTVGTEALRVKLGGSAPVGARYIVIPRAEAQEVERSARMDKKGWGSFTIDGSAFVFRPEAPGKDAPEKVVARVYDELEARPYVKLFKQCSALLERLEQKEYALPQAISFQPDLLARFNKVKVEGENNPVMDLWIYHPDNAVVVKIGPSFRGAIAPVAREVTPHENLWEELT